MAGCFFKHLRSTLWFSALLLWTVIHNPPPWMSEVDGFVVHANGCGFIADDLLIESEPSGHIRRARGRGLPGDTVVRQPAVLVADPVAIVRNPAAGTSWICHYAGRLRTHLLKVLNHWPHGRREWLQSFLLGADMHLDAVTTNALRRLGLLHIVVLSGSHIAVLSLFVLMTLRFVPLLLFSARILTMRFWPWIWTSTAVICILIVAVFSYTVGAPQSVQRAMVLCMVLQISDLFWIRKPIGILLLGVWLLQAVLFPVHILSMSMFLSWSGSLILSGILRSHFRKSWIAIFRERLLIQCIFAMLSLVVFGSLGLGSILANLMFGPLFSVLLPADLIVLFGAPNSVIAHILVEFQMKVLQFIRDMDVWQLDHPWMMFSLKNWLPKDSPWLKALQGLFLMGLIGRVYVRTRQRNRDSL